MLFARRFFNLKLVFFSCFCFVAREHWDRVRETIFIFWFFCFCSSRFLFWPNSFIRSNSRLNQLRWIVFSFWRRDIEDDALVALTAWQFNVAMQSLSHTWNNIPMTNTSALIAKRNDKTHEMKMKRKSMRTEKCRPGKYKWIANG